MRGDDALGKLEKMRPCEWVKGGFLHSMFYYVKKTGEIPYPCDSCWQVLAYFGSERDYYAFSGRLREAGLPDASTIQISGRRHKSEIAGKVDGEFLMVIYTHGERERDEVASRLMEIITEGQMTCRMDHKKAGHYWQDMFPEMFGFVREDYRPLTQGYFDFRDRAERLSEEELVQRVAQEIDWMERDRMGAPSL